MFFKKKEKIKRPNVSLVAVSSVKIDETIRALEYSMEGIDFGEVMFITHEKPKNLPDTIVFKKCRLLKNVDDYSRFMVYDLAKYIDTPFALHIHYDGFIVRPEKWRDAFLDYDYVGAPWPEKLHYSRHGKEVRVGNGACSLRSKKLLEARAALPLILPDGNGRYVDSKGNPVDEKEVSAHYIRESIDPKREGAFSEDGVCTYFRDDLESQGIKFAPVSLASEFSRELDCPDSSAEPFGFHKNFSLRPRLFLLKHFLIIDLAKEIIRPIARPVLNSLRALKVSLKKT